MKRKTAQVQDEVDWAKRRADWLQELDELYASMEGHLRPYTEAREIRIERTPIQLREDHLGSYDELRKLGDGKADVRVAAWDRQPA